MSEQEDAEELWAAEADQDRITSDPAETEFNDQVDLTESIEAAIADVDAGERQPTLTIRHDDLASLIYGLEDADELERVHAKALNELDVDDVDTATRSGTLAALVRIGIRQIDEELINEFESAKLAYTESKVSGL